MDSRDIYSRFRAEVREWLSTHCPIQTMAPAFTQIGLEERRDWETKLYEAGYSVLSWPREYGGQKADLRLETIFREESIRLGVPERLNKIAISMVGPILLRYGTPEQRERWLLPIAKSAEIWCQGFSETEAGSDLAALRTRGVVLDDVVVVNGQKVWTTSASFADWMFALVRTDQSAPRREGISLMMIPLKLTGVDVRPIRQLHGEPNFAEVFLSDVEVPIENVIGEINTGWQLAKEMLSLERASALASHVALSRDVQELIEVVHATGYDAHPGVRHKVARAFAISEGFRAHTVACLDDPVRDLSSTTKLVWSETRRDVFETVIEALHSSDGAFENAASEREYWHARASEIFGGASEVQRDIISSQQLGLHRR